MKRLLIFLFKYFENIRILKKSKKQIYNKYECFNFLKKNNYFFIIFHVNANLVLICTKINLGLCMRLFLNKRQV
jgi:hypothetical protein